MTQQHPSTNPKAIIKDGWISYAAIPLASLPPGARARLQQLGQRACELRLAIEGGQKGLGPEQRGIQQELGELEAELRERYGALVRRPLIVSVAPVQITNQGASVSSTTNPPAPIQGIGKPATINRLFGEVTE